MVTENENQHYSIGNGSIRVDKLRYINQIPGFVAAYSNKVLIYDERETNDNLKYSIFQRLSEYELFVGEPGNSIRCDLTHIKYKTDDSTGLDQNMFMPESLGNTLVICKFKRYYGYGKRGRPQIYDIEHNYMAYVIISKNYLKRKVFSFAVNYVDGHDPIAVIGLTGTDSSFAIPLRELVYCIAESLFESGGHFMTTIMDSIPTLIENPKLTIAQKISVNSVINQVYHYTDGYVFLGHMILVSVDYMRYSNLSKIPGMHYVITHEPTKIGYGLDIQLTDGYCDYTVIFVNDLSKMTMNAIHNGDWHNKVINVDNDKTFENGLLDGGTYVSLSDPAIRFGSSNTNESGYMGNRTATSVFAEREFVRASLPEWESSGIYPVAKFGRISIYTDMMRKALEVADSKWPLASAIISSSNEAKEVTKEVMKTINETPALKSAPAVPESTKVETVDTAPAVKAKPADNVTDDKVSESILATALDCVPDFDSYIADANAVCLLLKGKALSVSAIGGTAKYVKFCKGSKSVSGFSESSFDDVTSYVSSHMKHEGLCGMEFEYDDQKVVIFVRPLQLKNPSFVAKFVTVSGSKTEGNRKATIMGIASTPAYRDLYRWATLIGEWPGDLFPNDYTGGKKPLGCSFKWLILPGIKPADWKRPYTPHRASKAPVVAASVSSQEIPVVKEAPSPSITAPTALPAKEPEGEQSKSVLVSLNKKPTFIKLTQPGFSGFSFVSVSSITSAHMDRSLSGSVRYLITCDGNVVEVDQSSYAKACEALADKSV